MIILVETNHLAYINDIDFLEDGRGWVGRPRTFQGVHMFSKAYYQEISGDFQTEFQEISGDFQRKFQTISGDTT